MPSHIVDPSSDATTGYHLFFEPTGSIAAELRAKIAQLAAEYGGPVFAPHVTLLARIPEKSEEIVIKKAEALAASFSPITLTLGELATEQSYYRALYCKILEQDTMRMLYEKSAGAFSLERKPDYIAHLSLLYGNLPEELLQNLTRTVHLPTEKSFIVDRLHVYRTEGKVGQWYKVGEIPFSAVHKVF